MVVEAATILESISWVIIENLAKTGEELSFSLKRDGSIHDYFVVFTGENGKYKATIEDASIGEKEHKQITAAARERVDLSSAVDATLHALPSDVIKAIVDSGRNLHFTFGENSKSLRQVEVTGHMQGTAVEFEVSIDKVFHGLFSFLNGTVSNKRTLVVRV